MTVDYEHFISQLRKPEADALRSKLQAFLLHFSEAGVNLQIQRKLIANFLESIYKDSENHLAFVHEDQPFDEENVREGWEKLVMSKLFDAVFGAPTTDEHRSNSVLTKKIQTYSWVEERHLDIPINFSLRLEVAQAELLRINGYKSPRDKLVILKNVTQIIVDLIKKCGKDDKINNDVLLPVLILVVIRASPPNFISNIKYIMRYRNPVEIELGENQFCMTNFMGAVSFIYNMTSKSLTLNESERSKWPGESKSNESLLRFNRPNELSTAKEELKQFTGQVGEFFGNFFKEVKQTADELINNVSSPENPEVFTPASGAPGASNPTTPQNSYPSNVNSVEARQQLLRQQQELDENYEMELALAMSLSEAAALEDSQVVIPTEDDEEERSEQKCQNSF
ncbi:hypothetical protein BC833DRAFT_602155 [Globomyces pollinis-pini]|nr:hypothetical protein BC833DRAFT_602155 [Globomyces pollinis-pini]